MSGYKEDQIAERRVRLDGGLNTRDNPFVVNPAQVVDAQNMRGDETGTLRLRDGASRIVAPNFADDGVYGTSLAGIDTGGTLVAGAQYQIALGFVVWGTTSPSSPDILNPSVTATSGALPAGANDNSLRIGITGQFLGEILGHNEVNAVDDIFSGGWSSSRVFVYAKRTGTGDSLTLQAGGPVTFTYNDATARYEYVLTDYTTNGAVAASASVPMPVQAMFYNRIADRLHVIIAGRDHTTKDRSFTSLNAVDNITGFVNNGGTVITTGWAHFARSSVKISHTTIQGLDVFSDTFGNRRYSPDNLFPLGARAPELAPSVANAAAGSLPAGTYKYKYTNIYRYSRTKAPGVLEYVYAESRPSVSASVTVGASRRIDITLSATTASGVGADTARADFYRVRIYRTKANEDTYYRLRDETAAGTFQDNTLDASLGSKTDPDDAGKIPLDEPPQGPSFYSLVTFRNRVFGLECSSNLNAPSENRGMFRGSNIVRVSRQALAVYADPNGSDTEDCESNVDHFPDTADYTIVCGSAEGCTELVVYRDRIYVFKEREIGFISGEAPGEFVYTPIYNDLGAMPRSIINVAESLYFLNSDRGIHRFDGAEYEWLGYPVFPTWQTDMGSGYWCRNVVYSSRKNEIRWSMTDAQRNPVLAQLTTNQSNLASVRGTWKEWTLNPITKSIFPFNGTNNGRDVRAAVEAFRRSSTLPQETHDVYIGTTLGAICVDHGANDDPRSASVVAITGSATFRFHGLSEDFDFVKLFKQVMITYSMGTPTNGGTVTIKARFSESTSFATIGTLSATTIGNKTTVLTVPAQLVDGISHDRGLQLKIDSTVDTTLNIYAIVVRYKEITPVRERVR